MVDKDKIMEWEQNNFEWLLDNFIAEHEKEWNEWCLKRKYEWGEEFVHDEDINDIWFDNMLEEYDNAMADSAEYLEDR